MILSNDTGSHTCPRALALWKWISESAEREAHAFMFSSERITWHSRALHSPTCGVDARVVRHSRHTPSTRGRRRRTKQDGKWGAESPRRVNFLVRPRFEVDARHGGAKQAREVFPHGQLDRLAAELDVDARLLADERHVAVADAVAALHHALARLLHEDGRVGAAQPRIVVREELADVGHRERAEDRVHDRVVHHVTVRVRDAPQLKVWRVPCAVLGPPPTTTRSRPDFASTCRNAVVHERRRVFGGPSLPSKRTPLITCVCDILSCVRVCVCQERQVISERLED